MLVCVLGRQPKLGIAELEALVGPDSVRPFGENCAIVERERSGLSQDGLGGTVKIGEVLATIPSIKWTKVHDASRLEIVRRMAEMAKGAEHKLTLGISAYGFGVSPRQVRNLAFEAKKKLAGKGVSARVVTVGDYNDLNSAQVIHNKLTGEFGGEFMLVSDSEKTHVARTLSVQDIASYSKRDYDRPRRDLATGMMPPKLAQIMLNLAQAGPNNAVLDPFCGTGTILMEAALKRSRVIGSDIRPVMLDCSRDNLEWLSREYRVDVKAQLVCADASSHRWKGFDRVVSETYLGPLFTRMPDPRRLHDAIRECDELVGEFLTNLRPQLDRRSRCCIAVPAWNTPQGRVSLPVVRMLGELGYLRVEFRHVGPEELVYSRPDQLVGRELLVLTVR
jgi:tRNA G10  N-methylase Trm11